MYFGSVCPTLQDEYKEPLSPLRVYEIRRVQADVLASCGAGAPA